MDREFGLDAEQRDLVAAVRRFARERAAPVAVEHERRGEFPRQAFRELGALGLGGITWDERFGGGGQSHLSYLVVLEEVATTYLALAVALSVHHLATFALHEFASEDLKHRYVPRLSSGEWLGAYALSEASSGSDAASLRTRAVRDDGRYRLDGTKRFITHGGEAELYLVMARTGGEGPAGISAFAVENGDAGLSFGALERKMGWASSPMRELVFSGCELHADRLVGDEGDGFRIALAALDGGRLGIAASSTGLAQGAFDAALSYVKERRQFGKRIVDLEGVQFMLADMATGIEAARRLYREAARTRDAGADFSTGASMAKLFASDVAMRVTTDAVQLFGGYGYMQEYPVERYMREAKALQIVEGTNQIQRFIIGRRLARP